MMNLMAQELVKTAKELIQEDRGVASLRFAWTDKVDNDIRPSRMKKPVVTPNAHRVYKLYIQDLLHNILVDKYGTKRGTENFEYFVDKGGGAFFAVGQQIQDEKAQMYIDLGEKIPTDYFSETYFDVWKRWMSNRMGKGIVSSMSRHCSFYKARDGQWYMQLADREYGEEHTATTYGPFQSRDAALKYLDNFSNPGSLYEDGSGNRPVPKRSPNGKPVERPTLRQMWGKSGSTQQGGNMNREAVANELLRIAESLVAMEFPTQDAMDKYLKDHPEADKSKHKVVKQDPANPDTHPYNLMLQRKNEKKIEEIAKRLKKDPKDVTTEDIMKFNKKARSVSAVVGSKVFINSAHGLLTNLLDMCAENIDGYSRVPDGADAVAGYRKVYKMIEDLRRRITAIIQISFD